MAALKQTIETVAAERASAEGSEKAVRIRIVNEVYSAPFQVHSYMSSRRCGFLLLRRRAGAGDDERGEVLETGVQGDVLVSLGVPL